MPTSKEARCILTDAITGYRFRTGYDPEYVPESRLIRAECKGGTVWTVRVASDRQIQFHLAPDGSVHVTAHGHDRHNFWTPYGVVKRSFEVKPDGSERRLF